MVGHTTISHTHTYHAGSEHTEIPQRDTPERRERALLFLTEEETNKELRESRTTALSRTRSLKRAHSGRAKTEFIIHSGGVLFIVIVRTRARKFTKCTRRLSAGKKRRAIPPKTRKGKRSVTKVNHVLRSGTFCMFFFTD